MRNFNQNIRNLRNLILAKNLYTEGRSLPFINIGLMVHADTLLMFYFICNRGLFTPFNMIEWKTHLSILQGLFLDFAYFFKILLTSFKGFSCFPFPETRLAVTDWCRGILLLAVLVPCNIVEWKSDYSMSQGLFSYFSKLLTSY